MRRPQRQIQHSAAYPHDGPRLGHRAQDTLRDERWRFHMGVMSRANADTTSGLIGLANCCATGVGPAPHRGMDGTQPPLHGGRRDGRWQCPQSWVPLVTDTAMVTKLQEFMLRDAWAVRGAHTLGKPPHGCHLHCGLQAPSHRNSLPTCVFCCSPFARARVRALVLLLVLGYCNSSKRNKV